MRRRSALLLQLRFSFGQRVDRESIWMDRALQIYKSHITRSMTKVCEQKQKKKRKSGVRASRVKINARDSQLIKPPEQVHRTGDGWICTVSINLRFPALAE
jgi:hypothetical protein